MRLGKIALKLRMADTRFKTRVGGSAELALALAGTLDDEMAFVIPISEACPENSWDSGINQKVTERFAVVVAVYNDSDAKDKLGIVSYDSLHEIRKEVWGAILGWQQDDSESLTYYRGGRLLQITRAFLWYQFEFEQGIRITNSDGIDTGSDALSYFNKVWSDMVLNGAQTYTGTLPIGSQVSDSITRGAFNESFDGDFNLYNDGGLNA